jgi:hypothetical protein
MNNLHIPEIQNNESDTSDTTTKKASLYAFDSTGTTKKRLTGTASGENFSLNVSDGTLNSLIETLQELAQRLAPLAGTVASTAQIRAVVTGAVTATGGGYITSAQNIANILTQTTSLIGYNRQVLDNILAIQSNLNNITAK